MYEMTERTKAVSHNNTKKKQTRQEPRKNPVNYWGDSSKPIQRFYAGFYEDYGAYHYDKHDNNNVREVENYVDGLSRNDLGWYSDTREKVLARTEPFWHNMPHRTIFGNIAFRPTRLYECQCCHEFVPYAAVDIGHIMQWRDYLKLVGARNHEEAMIAYNELENLRVECATCNRSHDYEAAVNEEEELELVY